MLTSLALEIVFLILDRLPTEAQLSLRATCKAFLRIITPQLFSDFCIEICCPTRRYKFDEFRFVHLQLSEIQQHTRRQLQRLQSLSNPYCTIAPYVISLHIAPILDPLLTDNEIQTVLLQHLTSSISKLHNLETVR
jgi:F-box-like